MALTAQHLLDRVQTHLVDEGGDTWGRAELRNLLTDAQRELVGLRPEVYTVTEAVQLEPGVRQQVPQGGVWLVDVPRSLGKDGKTPRRTMRRVARADLDAADPDWPTKTPRIEAVNWALDDRDPRRWWVYPPQPDPAGYVELVYTPNPPAVGEEEGEIALEEIYAPALLDYVLSWALTKESDAQQSSKAQQHYQRFVAAVTGRLAEQ